MVSSLGNDSFSESQKAADHFREGTWVSNQVKSRGGGNLSPRNSRQGFAFVNLQKNHRHRQYSLDTPKLYEILPNHLRGILPPLAEEGSFSLGFQSVYLAKVETLVPLFSSYTSKYSASLRLVRVHSPEPVPP